MKIGRPGRTPEKMQLLIGAFMLMIFLVLAVITFVNYQVKAPLSIQSAKPAQQPRSQREAALQKQFSDFLDAFLKKINEDVTAYKKEKKVIVESVNPLNLRDPSYVVENHNLMQQLIPSLRDRMTEVLANFSTANARVDELLKDQPPEIQQPIRNEWKEMKRKHVQVYIDFFSYESELLTAYQELMDFYFNKRNDFKFDEANMLTVFPKAEDAAEETRLKQNIEDLYTAQKDTLGKEDPANADKQNSTPESLSIENPAPRDAAQPEQPAQ